MRRRNWKPLAMLGLMITVGIMVGAMIVIMMIFSRVGDMGQMVFGTSALGMMIIPLIGLIAMVLMMLIFFRKMVGRGGPMSMMGRSYNTQQNDDGKNLTVLNYIIPAVSCGHCKTTIEHEVGKLSGVASVNVDVDSKQTIIKLDPSPATKAEIEALLAKIGYPPQSQ